MNKRSSLSHKRALLRGLAFVVFAVPIFLLIDLLMQAPQSPTLWIMGLVTMAVVGTASSYLTQKIQQEKASRVNNAGDEQTSNS